MQKWVLVDKGVTTARLAVPCLMTPSLSDGPSLRTGVNNRVLVPAVL